jgi:membrane-associated phospholipid phosphatase
MRSNRTSNCLFGLVLSAILFSAAAGVQAQAPPPTPSPTASATPQTPSTPSLESQFFKNILRDQKAIWTAPFHLHSRDARWLAPISLGTAAFIATDQRTGDEVAESDSPLNASRIVSYAGSAYGVGSVAAAFYVFGRAKHDERARETGMLGAEALVDSAIVVTVVKEITQRSRPTAGVRRSDFFDGGSSFPSGHAIEAWSLATIIANEYHDRPLVQISAYGIASAVSVARFTGRNHYLSDVLVGSAIGYGIGRYVYHAHHRKSPVSGGEEESSERLRRRPMIAPLYSRALREYGVALAWSF